MEKKIVIDENAGKELREFSLEVQDEFQASLDTLRKKGRLESPEGKKISKDIFEVRVKIKGEYRGLFTYFGKTNILVLHFFRKKTQKTPVKKIKNAQRRLKQYEQN